MAGNLAVARRESLMNNRALDFGPASLGVVSAPSSPSCGQSQTPLAMPANGTSHGVRLVPSRGASGDGTVADSRHYEAMFVSHLDVVESVIRHVCQRQKLSGSDAEEFDSEVKVRLVDHDYEVFRKFQHRSSRPQQPAHLPHDCDSADLPRLPEPPVG